MMNPVRKSQHGWARLTPWNLATGMVATAIATLLSSAAPVFAQTPPEAESLVLPELSVSGVHERANGPVSGYRAERSSTGTMTDTPLREVPQSIQVVPRDVITDQAAVRLNDALDNVSGVRPQGSSGGRSDNFIIRGFPSSQYAVDGVVMSPAFLVPGSTFRDLANIERVEVLKGPASVLFGQGDPGGMINLITRQPQLTPAGSLTLQGGSYGFFRNEFDLTGPIGSSGTIAGRISGAIQRENGFVRNQRDAEREFFAPSVTWQPNDRTRVYLGAGYIHARTPITRGIPAIGTGVSLPRWRTFEEPGAHNTAIRSDVNWRVEHDATDWLTIRQIGRLEWGSLGRLGVVTTSLAANGITMNRRANLQDTTTRNLDFRLEALARFNTGVLSHQFLAGVQYASADEGNQLMVAPYTGINILNPVFGAGRQTGPYTYFTDRRTAFDMTSLYAQDQMTYGRLRFVAGGRYDTFDQSAVDANPSRPIQYGTISGSAFTPRVGVVWLQNPNLSFYAGFARSFTPQNGADAIGNRFNPETGQQFEIGTRYDLIPDRLSANLALYNIRRKNVLAADPNDSTFNIQTGEQRSRGVELDITGQVLPNWRVIASAAYTDAEVTQDTTFAVGHRLTGVPLWSGSLWSTFQFGQGPLTGLTVGAGAYMASRRTGDLNNSFRVAGYTRIDAMASYPLTNNLHLQLNIRNLFDADYIEAPRSRNENYPGAPMTAIATIRAAF
ncbi:MAG: hypothetical protein JWR10_3584 [Rubritepida sp.]|nr:hypothetical protein [Rubritepida sp.]